MTVQYQGVWTLQSAAQLQSTQRWVTDPLFENTTLLLQADDAANGAQNNTFLDSSSNSFAITRNGNTTQGSFTPFSQAPGYWGNYFDGTGDYITAAGANLALGTGNFTIEFWFYANAYSSAVDSAFMFDSRSGNNTSGFFIGPVFNNTQTLHVGQNTSPIITANTTYPLNTWVHCAVVRSSGTITLYQNGVNVGSVANTTNNTATTNYIGSGWWLPSGAGQMFNGYLSNLRISNTARYTANFNPAANVFVSDGNTVLLTCQSNRFVDGSSNGYTITVGGGTPSVQPFSPFAPQFQWTPSVIGGSGYFDGSGDYLSAPSSADFGFGTGDFTLECWVYPLASTAQRLLFGGGDMNNLDIGFTPANTFQYYDGTVRDTGVSAASRQWFHFAVSRTSGTTSIYVNGTRTNNFSDTSNTSTRQYFVGGSNTGTNPFNGYISGARIIKGTGIYSGTTIALPTAPLTPITNTRLLLNFTNAGIVDATMKNNLETVGNAQVSTAVVKYGSGSMFFNGTTDYLRTPTIRPLYEFYTGDFTIEAWVRFNSISATYQTLAGIWLALNKYGWLVQMRSTDVLFAYGNVGSSPASVTFSWTPATNTWYHFAITRSGSSVKAFIDGTQIGSTQTISSSIQADTPLWVGANQDSGPQQYWNGYIDDLRITKGIARYTQNFIPPSVALPRQ